MDGLWLCMLVGRDYNLLFAVSMYSGVAVARAHVLLPVSTHVGPDFYIVYRVDQIQDTVPPGCARRTLFPNVVSSTTV